MKWLSRDSIEEVGGMNLYGFCANCPLTSFDTLGTTFIEIGPTRHNNEEKAPASIPWASGWHVGTISHETIFEDCDCGKKLTDIKVTVVNDIYKLRWWAWYSRGGDTTGATLEEHELGHAKITTHHGKTLEQVLSGFKGKCLKGTCLAAVQLVIMFESQYFSAKNRYDQLSYDYQRYYPGDPRDKIGAKIPNGERAVEDSANTVRVYLNQVEQLCKGQL